MLFTISVTVYLQLTLDQADIDKLAEEMKTLDGNIVRTYFKSALEAAGVTQLAADGNIYCNGSTYEKVGVKEQFYFDLSFLARTFP